MFRNHPRALFYCFATELWERFSYYGMRALLVFFLTRHFLFDDGESFALYGAYGALAYAMPVLGGWVGDRWLGARNAVTFGGMLLVAGHFGLAFEGPPAVRAAIAGTIQRDAVHLELFYLSLALIVTGVGFLKSNITALIGSFYRAQDPRRDAGFTLFYMSGNLGGAIAPILCGWLGQAYGWSWGFGAAGFGMLLGLAIFLRGERVIRNDEVFGSIPERRPGAAIALAASLLLVPLCWALLRDTALVGALLVAVTLGSVGFVAWYAAARCTPDARRKLLVCTALIAVTVCFWALYEQMGSSLNLFADRFVDRRAFGVEIPASTLQSLPAIYVVLLAPLFGALWIRLARRGREPGTAGKFALALLQLACAFLVLALVTRATPVDDKIPLVWFALNFLLLVTGELCLAPVAMSMVTALSPAPIVGTMVGLFYLAYAGSSFIAGRIARLTTAQVGEATTHLVYGGVYLELGLFAALSCTVLVLLLPLFRRAAQPRAA